MLRRALVVVVALVGACGVSRAAEQPQGVCSNNPALGLVAPEDAGERLADRLAAPAEGLPLRKAPGAEVVGVVLPNWTCQLGPRTTELHANDHTEIAPEATALHFYRVEAGHVLVLKHTLAEGAWVSLADLRHAGLTLWPWKSFLIRASQAHGLEPHRDWELREGPSAEYRLVARLRYREPGSHIRLTGRTLGPWAEGIAEQGRFGVRSSGSLQSVHRGWLRILDDNGRLLSLPRPDGDGCWPLLWWATRGC